MLLIFIMSEIHYTRLPSPIGEITLVTSEKGLRGGYMEEHNKAPLTPALWEENPCRFAKATKQLAEYFSGKRKTFDLPLDL